MYKLNINPAVTFVTYNIVVCVTTKSVSENYVEVDHLRGNWKVKSTVTYGLVSNAGRSCSGRNSW